MAKPKLVVTRRWPQEVEERLQALFDVQLNPSDTPLTVADLQEALRTADALLPTVSDRISAEVLSAEPLSARILGNFGVGFNHIDIDAAKARGLVVTNTPEVLTDCTADLAMTLLFMAARRAGLSCVSTGPAFETVFSRMARTFLKGIRVASREELKQRILQGIHEMNLAPVVMRWKKFDLGLVNS